MTISIKSKYYGTQETSEGYQNIFPWKELSMDEYIKK